jgi:ribosomal protein S18 acetylase RimI-like enzyme
VAARADSLSLFSSNDRAFHVYEKAGYHVVARISKAVLKFGEYFDELVMTREMPQLP